MARFHGKIGFVKTEETSPGVHEEIATEKEYSGEIIRNQRNWESSGQMNDNPTINNRFSIVADQFANENIGSMRYLTWNGKSWKITDVEIQRPRLILNIGGLYNK